MSLVESMLCSVFLLSLLLLIPHPFCFTMLPPLRVKWGGAGYPESEELVSRPSRSPEEGGDSAAGI